MAPRQAFNVCSSLFIYFLKQVMFLQSIDLLFKIQKARVLYHKQAKNANCIFNNFRWRISQQAPRYW